MNNKNNKTNELFAEARAIYLAMQQGVITREQAKHRTQPLLGRINAVIEQIASKHKVKPTYITFSDLGRNI